MIVARLRQWAAASQRQQRLALLACVAPFWLAFVGGALARVPLPLFIGAFGVVAIVIAYQFLGRDFRREEQPEPWETSNEP